MACWMGSSALVTGILKVLPHTNRVSAMSRAGSRMSLKRYNIPSREHDHA
jgi:hypothetical protein